MSRPLRLLGGLFVVLAALLALGAAPASAQWRVQQGVDVATGGPSLLLIGTMDAQTGFYASCVGGRTSLFIEAYDGRTEDLQLSGIVSIGVTLDGDNDTLWWSDGQQSRRPGYLTTAWTDAAATDRVLSNVMAAQATITLSIYTPVVRTITDWHVSAQGSTAATREFIALCDAQAPAQQPSPQLSPLPEPDPQQPAPQLQPLPQQQPAQQPPAGQQGSWSFTAGAQPELVGPASGNMQMVLICVAEGVAILLVENTDLMNFPTIRSSRDGVLIVGFDTREPLTVVVGPGPSRPGVQSVVADDPADAAKVLDLLAEPGIVEMAMLVGDRQRSTITPPSVYGMAGALEAAEAFRAACRL